MDGKYKVPRFIARHIESKAIQCGIGDQMDLVELQTTNWIKPKIPNETSIRGLDDGMVISRHS